MKKLIKLIREETDGTITPVDVRKAEVSRDGLRAVDSGTFIVPSRIPVSKGNIFKYIQDVADTTYLRGAYLFQGSCLDESGYNVDPKNQTHHSISGWDDYDGLDYAQNTTADHKFRGTVYGTLDHSSQKGAILENSSHHDFSGDFDIFIWITKPASGVTNGYKALYTKTDATTFGSSNGGSSGNGIRIGMLNQSSGVKPYVHMDNASTNITLNTSGGYIDATKGLCIRVRRMGNTVSLWAVDGTTDIPFGTPDDTATVSGDFTVTKQAVIGANPSAFSGDNVTDTTDRWKGGYFHSMRIYCGGTLSSPDAKQIYSARPIPLIMKLAGSVWKVEENIDTKRIFVKGFGKVITDTLVSDQLMTAGDADGEFYHSGASRTLNAFTSAYPVEIIRAIFAKINAELSSNSTFKLSLRDLSGSGNTMNTYTAEGNFLEIINQLMLIVDKSFYVSPRGKCILENKNTDLTNTLIFRHNRGYVIGADGFDDSITTNDLYVASRAGGNFAVVHTSDQTSINTIGIYSRRVLAPQLTDATSVTQFKDKFLAEFKDINTRYTITAPALIDFVRENFMVTIKNSVKNLNTPSTVKSVTWHYPDARTVIETGDHLLDAFDLEKVSSDTINNIVTDTTLNP